MTQGASAGNAIDATSSIGSGIIDRVRILIVEDDAALASGIARILEGEGHAVDVMATGEHAVLGARQESFGLVILDVGLPGIDGFEVLRRLRADGERAPVLVLTARDALDDRVRGLDLGADDYMAKPFAMPELAARVRALVRRSQAQTGPKIVHGPLSLDTVARRAQLSGAPFSWARRATVSSIRGPCTIFGPLCACERRTSARTRAASSGMAKGFAM